MGVPPSLSEMVPLPPLESESKRHPPLQVSILAPYPSPRAAQNPERVWACWAVAEPAPQTMIVATRAGRASRWFVARLIRLPLVSGNECSTARTLGKDSTAPVKRRSSRARSAPPPPARGSRAPHAAARSRGALASAPHAARRYGRAGTKSQAQEIATPGDQWLRTTAGTYRVRGTLLGPGHVLMKVGVHSRAAVAAKLVTA